MELCFKYIQYMILTFFYHLNHNSLSFYHFPSTTGSRISSCNIGAHLAVLADTAEQPLNCVIHTKQARDQISHWCDCHIRMITLNKYVQIAPI